ncbi:MAG TPA: NAD(P)/FAD-dependent oxidoreductase [Bacillota bacterium]|nr:NAD(P)/FAD-dependent oxidoreductase [Bacillota bacterium]
MTWQMIVVGGGAAGMMAAFTAAKAGVRVLLLERNRTLGRKLFITGSGRCNLTNQAEVNELIANVPGNGRFLYSAFQQFGPGDLMDIFQTELKVPLKVERGRRVFPVSDKSKDILVGLEDGLAKYGVTVLTEKRVTKLLRDAAGNLSGVRCESGEEYQSRVVVLTTGGVSYPGTGSTGDGYRLVEALGHTIVSIFPSLVPLETAETWPKEVEGLALNNINAAAFHQGKKLAAEFGDLLFTGFGVSGPVILSLSRKIVPLVLEKPGSVILRVDLKPALSEEELDRRIQRDFAKFVRKQYKNALDELLPKSLIPVMIELSGIDPLKPVHQITKEERTKLVNLFKQLPLTIAKPRSLAEAIVTAGGVSVKEINPKTMESKIVPGLYLAGEVVDVDGFTGGYNLQIAFSMGYAAGQAVAAGVMH